MRPTAPDHSGSLTPPSVRPGEDRLARVAEPSVDVSNRFDLERGLVDRTIFSDPAVYRQELRRVFAPSWLFLAHESQFSRPGDFFTTYMGEDPVIVTMGKDRRLRAFLNACRHRGRLRRDRNDRGRPACRGTDGCRRTAPHRR
ncbi:Rieske 2Fe-2S domain-containing protein, partial [Streptomyces sp. NPDC007162]|uniref:Rieske 2Fe-2S domain-containing protein n=1 Tax=Streptomyces sp. NPDC007162 TaxID=3156917 RepID=UPI0033E294CF